MTTVQIVSLIAAVFACSGFWQWLIAVGEKRSKKRKQTPQDLMLLALGRAALLDRCKKYQAMGYIPLSENGTFNKLYDAYLSMGGNSEIKELCEQTKLLDIISD